MARHHLTHAQWVQVVMVAGIGTVLEWLDYYIYAQMNATIEEVFFPTTNPTIQTLSFWGVYAVAFVVRPLGGLLFGHIGDTYGRNKCLTISICTMAICTVLIGMLPTYNIGKYRAGLAASILLALLRLVQGLAMGGEFGSAVIYISELAEPSRRGLFVAILQISAHLGMILATALVMLLQNTLSRDEMLIWGWRVPFLCAFGTALLGAFLRRGMPEPHAFLHAARVAKREERESSGGRKPASRCGSASGLTAAAISGALPASADLDVEIVARSSDGKKGDVEDGSSVTSSSDSASAAEEEEHLQETPSHGKTPLVRLLKNNRTGLLLHILFMAWVSGAFYLNVSWVPKDLRTYGYPLITTQLILIVAITCNAAGLILTGWLIDRGIRAIWSKAAIAVVGTALAFAVYPGVGKSLHAAWGLTCLIHFFTGCGAANVALPCTRIYEPLARTSGFSFGYNFGFGVIGGLSPLAVSAIKAALPHASAAFAPALWLLALCGATLAGCVALSVYRPRLGQAYVGKLE